MTSINKNAKKFLIWAAVILILAIGGWRVYKLAPKTNEPPPGQFYEAQSRDHILSGASHPDYNSNPPTGGWHYAAPAQTGIYDKEFPDEEIVHNLEHGHIWISYRPDLAADQVEKLAEIAQSYGSRIIITLRAKNDSPIAVVAWQYLLKMDSVDEEQIRNFVKAHRNIAGPERNIPDFGFKDFRSKI